MTGIKWILRIMRWSLAVLGLAVTIIVVLLAAPLSQPPELASISADRQKLDFTGLPEIQRVQARDGSALAYRFYPAADGNRQKIVILVHGSSGGSASMNAIAKELAAENIAVAALDIRGHGDSGTRGDIGYLGQLDDDLADFVAALQRQNPGAHFGLLGFSAGGGFALRVASSSAAFDRVVLLSPYLGYDAPTSRSVDEASRWADADIPRVLALRVLQQVHLPCCEGLPILAFAVPANSEKTHTAQYSFRLAVNFAAPHDLSAAFRKLSARTTIIAGAEDELMVAGKYADLVQGIEPKIDVKIMPGLRHLSMLYAPPALAAIGAAFKAWP